jgi:hypothetical protein
VPLDQTEKEEIDTAVLSMSYAVGDRVEEGFRAIHSRG